VRQFKLNKTTEKKLDKYKKNKNLNEDLYKELYNIIFLDVRSIRDCSEKNIVDFYIEEFNNMYNKIIEENFINENLLDFFNEAFWEKLKINTRMRLVNKYVSKKTYDNNIDIYFNEVKREYILHPQNESEELEFNEENRDIFIKNNLKLAVNCAKRYRNLGLSFEDLIQVANYGLLVAFDKFDTERSNLRVSIIKDIKRSKDHHYTVDEITEILKRNFTYTKLLDSTLKKIPLEGFENKIDFLDWANSNIKAASFSSISFFWIRAIIINELNNYSKIIKVPKTVLDKDEDSDEEATNKISIIQLDSINPYTEDNYADGQLNELSNEEFTIEDNSLEETERQNTFKELIDKILYKLPATDRRIIIKKFGIGQPFPMSIVELAENENIPVNKIKYIISNAMKLIRNNINEYDRATISELLK